MTRRAYSRGLRLKLRRDGVWLAPLRFLSVRSYEEPIMFEPTVVSRYPNNLDVYVTNTAEGISSLSWNGGPDWTSWHNFTPDEMSTTDGRLLKVSSGPAAVSNAPGHVTLFVQGSDTALWTKWFNEREGWSKWNTLGGSCTSAPTAATRQSQIHVFVRNSEGGLSLRTWSEDGSWSAWGNLPNTRRDAHSLAIPWQDTPAATCPSEDTITVYVASDGLLWQRWWTEDWANLDSERGDVPVGERGWRGWELLDRNDETIQVISAPAAIGNTVFAVGPARNMRTRHFVGGNPVPWSDWESLGGLFTSGPAAVSKANSQMDVFGRGDDGALWTAWFTSGAWSEWRSLGGTLSSPS